MNDKVTWYVARSSGIVAWALLTLAVVWGLLLSSRIISDRRAPKWLLDLHRFLGGLSVLFTGVHVVALVADRYVHFGAAEVLVPFASSWKPMPVALGVVGMWLLLAVEGTSLLMKRLPRARWHAVHLLSYVLFWTATLHGMLAGTERRDLAFAVANDVAALVVVFLTVYRVVAAARGRRRITPGSSADVSTSPTWARDPG